MVNTKFLMASSALTLALAGVSLTFLPAEIGNYLVAGSSKLPAIILQLLGAAYFGFAMINWMVKENIIGGIYNRPIALGNFIHFFMGGVALIKIVFANQEVIFLWIASIVYLLFTISFGLVLFTHPLKSESEK